MNVLAPITGLTVARSGVTCIGRILGNLGTPITQASLTSISYTVRNLTAATTIVAGVSLTVSSVVFDALQQGDMRWDKDSENLPGRDGRWGYNFLTLIPAAYFTSYDVDDESPYDVLAHVHRIDVRFTPVSGEVFIVPFQSTPLPAYVS